MQEVFLFERPNDRAFEVFIESNSTEIFDLFATLEKDQNYFAKREGLKTLYMLLVKNEKLRTLYTSDREKLKGIMLTVLIPNKGKSTNSQFYRNLIRSFPTLISVHPHATAR